MPRAKFKTLTEQMFYVLLCLKEETFGLDIMERIAVMTQQRVQIGNGTLYNLLEQFLEADLIRETKREGRRRSYILTEKGEQILAEEYGRICQQARDYHSMTMRVLRHDWRSRRKKDGCCRRLVLACGNISGYSRRICGLPYALIQPIRPLNLSILPGRSVSWIFVSMRAESSYAVWGRCRFSITGQKLRCRLTRIRSWSLDVSGSWRCGNISPCICSG